MTGAKMPFAVWQKEMGKFKNTREAEDWRARSRIEVEGLPSPWLEGQSTPPPLSVMPKPQYEAAPMDEEELPPEAQTGGESDDQPDFSVLGGNGGDLSVDFTKLNPQNAGALLNAAQAQQQQLIKQAQERLAARNRGLSRTEMLLALSNAMLKPTNVRGFAGFMGNLTGAFGDIAAAQRAAQEKRAVQEEQLSMLGSKNLIDLLKLYPQLTKQPNTKGPQYSINPTTNRWDVKPGEGGVPLKDSQGNWIVEDPAQMELLLKLDPTGYFISAQDKTRTRRHVSGGQ